MIRLSWVRAAAAVPGSLRTEYVSRLLPWHRSSSICPQVKGPQAWIARPFTKTAALPAGTRQWRHCFRAPRARFCLGRPPGAPRLPRLKAVAYPSGLSRGRACDSRLPGSDCPSHEPSARLWRLWVVAPLVMNARRVTQLGDGRYRNVLSGGDSFVSMAPAMVCP